MSKLFSLIFVVAIAAGIYYLVMPQPYPASVIQNTEKSDKFSNLLNTKRNVIMWSGTNNEISQDRNAEMHDLIRYNHYDRGFLYVADLSDDVVTCRNGSKKCIGMWMRKNCSTKYCIYIASTKKIHKINFKDKDKLLKTLDEYQGK